MLIFSSQWISLHISFGDSGFNTIMSRAPCFKMFKCATVPMLAGNGTCPVEQPPLGAPPATMSRSVALFHITWHHLPLPTGIPAARGPKPKASGPSSVLEPHRTACPSSCEGAATRPPAGPGHLIQSGQRHLPNQLYNLQMERNIHFYVAPSSVPWIQSSN